MKKGVLFPLALTLLTVANGLFAQGTAFTYQGQLNSSGSPANGSYDFTFTLFNNNSTNSGQIGNPLTNLDVGVSNGLFTVMLDFGSVFTGNATWLAIAVRANGGAGFSALSPLQELTPAPYAIYAPNAGTAASAGSLWATNIALHGNVNVDSNFYVAGNISAANLGTAAFSNASAFAPAAATNNYVLNQGGKGSNNLFSGMTTTNATNVNGFNQTNTAGHNALNRVGLDSTLVSGTRAWRWGGNPDAWEEWVTPNAVWWQDTNNQIAFRIMQGNDSIELGGNTQVDSNLTVLGGATITGNISAANLGSAAFLPATTWQGTNAALTDWQGTAPNNFIGSQGGQGSNNVFTGPLTTNLTEEGTLTAAGGLLTATQSGNITLANTGLNWLFTAANFGAVGSQNFVSHPQDGGAKFNTTSWSTNDTDAHWNMWGINPYGLNNTTNFCDIQSQAFGALDVAYIFYNVTNLQSTTTIADNWFGPTWNIIVQYAATNTAVVFPTSTNWSMSLYGGSFTWGRNSTLFGSNTVIFDELVAGTGNVTNVTADHATWYMGAGQAGTTNPVLTNGFAGSFIYVGSGTMAGIYNLNTGLFPSTGGGGNPTAGTNIVVNGSAVSVGAAVVTNSDVNARSLTNLINLHTFNTPSSNSMATVATAVNTAAGWVTAAVTNGLISTNSAGPGAADVFPTLHGGTIVWVPTNYVAPGGGGYSPDSSTIILNGSSQLALNYANGSAVSNWTAGVAAAYTNALGLGGYATQLYAQGLTNGFVHSGNPTFGGIVTVNGTLVLNTNSYGNILQGTNIYIAQDGSIQIGPGATTSGLTLFSWLYCKTNATFSGKQNIFAHSSDGNEQIDVASGVGTDPGIVIWGNNPLSGTSGGSLGRALWQSQYFGGVNRAFEYYNITNANGDLALPDGLFGPTWNLIAQTAAGNSTLTLPTSTNWSMSVWGGNNGNGYSSTLFGSNTCIFDIANVGGGNMTICTYDHAMIYMGGGQAASTNPVLMNGFACRLFYGGVNGTNIYNLNTGLFPSSSNDVSAGQLLQRQDVSKNRVVNTNILTAQPPTSWSGQMATINSGLTNTYHANLVYYYNGTGGSAVLYAAGGLSGADAAANPVITNAIATTGGMFILQPNDGVQIVSGSGVNAYARVGQ